MDVIRHDTECPGRDSIVSCQMVKQGQIIDEVPDRVKDDITINPFVIDMMPGTIYITPI